MLKYRPSKRFLWLMGCLCPLAIAVYQGVVPELEAIAQPKLRGEVRFPSPRPDPSAAVRPAVDGGARGFRWSMDWLEKSYDDLMSWDRNPWKTERLTFGGRYFKLLGSDDPRDRALAMELRRLGEALLQRVLARYPELAVPMRDVPPEKNGFLKWLEFSERMDADPSRPGSPKSKELGIPADLVKHLAGQAPWDPAAAAAWLEHEKALIDEIRAIGLMSERSVAGIEIDRWGFISARLAKSAAEALLLDARLAAEAGDIARALESVQAARGLADHFSQIETPSLLGVTVQILVQLQVQAYALNELIPALPAGQRDATAWENAVRPAVVPPSEYGRIMRGEWNVTARQYLMPMLSDAQDPKYPPDPEALIDHYAGHFVRVIAAHDHSSPSAWPSVSPVPVPDTGHLSRPSGDLMSILFVGEQAWSKGLRRSVSQAAMGQAAFAILRGESPPLDPLYGQPYRWDPATRTLSSPDMPAFQERELTPIVVPVP